ncbi:MAG: hypothetical protein JNL54_00420 [Kineosporiaceae bacterium]|nr:hypothetical protein [Kineosporiaceae bacterium]
MSGQPVDPDPDREALRRTQAHVVVEAWGLPADGPRRLTDADRAEIERGVRQYRQCHRLRPDEPIVWVGSPEELRGFADIRQRLPRMSRASRRRRILRRGRHFSGVMLFFASALLAGLILMDEHLGTGLRLLVLALAVVVGAIWWVVLDDAPDFETDVVDPAASLTASATATFGNGAPLSSLGLIHPDLGSYLPTWLVDLNADVYASTLVHHGSHFFNSDHPARGQFDVAIVDHRTCVHRAMAMTELAWFVACGDLVPSEGTRRLLEAAHALRRAYVTVVYRSLTLVLEPPTTMRFERRTGWRGPLILHCEDGPAIVWPTGEAQYFFHGTEVSGELVRGELSIPEIHALRNSEIRRFAIERLGWQNYLTHGGFAPIAEAPDPGNPSATLRLYTIPDVDGHLLVMRNGSPDRSGAPRHYAELVPASITDPVEAAAWQYGVPVEVYRGLQRRT